MKTNFSNLKRDLSSLFDADRPPPKAFIFVVFLIPAGVILRDMGVPDHHPAWPPLMYLLGGVIAWALIRGAQPEAVVDFRDAKSNTPLIAALVLRLGGKVELPDAELQPLRGRRLVASAGRPPDGGLALEVLPHG